MAKKTKKKKVVKAEKEEEELQDEVVVDEEVEAVDDIAEVEENEDVSKKIVCKRCGQVFVKPKMMVLEGGGKVESKCCPNCLAPISWQN